VLPDDEAILARLAAVQAAPGARTVPATLGLEKRTNPFLRADLERFTELRRRRDVF
jgi:hydroxyacylglutathione hydrolase